MIGKRYCATTVFLCLGLMSCGVNGMHSSSDCGGLSNFDPVKAEQEAMLAISKGDSKLLGVYGYTTEVPGVIGDVNILVRSHGVKMIEGTSDAILSDRCAALNKNAIDYAGRYNRRILK